MNRAFVHPRLTAIVWIICAIAIFNLTCTTSRAELPNLNERAFVDFHARAGSSPFGHSFIVYGRVDDRNQTIVAKVAGYRPKGQKSFVEGIIFPIPAKVGRARDDLNVASDIVWRPFLSIVEYRQLTTAIRQMQATDGAAWHLLFSTAMNLLAK